MRPQPTRKLARVDSKRTVVTVCVIIIMNITGLRTAHKAFNFLSVTANATLTAAARGNITTDPHM